MSDHPKNVEAPLVADMVNETGELSAINGARLDEVVSATHCFNCGNDAEGSFCPKCGQKKITKRLSFGRLLSDVPKTFFNLERGLMRTFFEMFVRPGMMARDFVYGQRKRYINPFSYFLVGATVQLISLWFTSSYIRESFKASIGNAAIPNRDKLEKIFDGNVGEGMADVYLAAIAQSYTYAALLFFALPWAFTLWVVHRSVGPKPRSQFRYAEVLVFTLYVVGHLLILTGVLMPIVLEFMPSIASFVGPTVYIGFAMIAHRGFFSKGLIPYGGSLAAILISMCIFFASIVAIFIGSIVATAAFRSMAGG